MEPKAIIEELYANRSVFEKLLISIPHEMIHWRQAPNKWSLLEIVAHLLDEEIEDFRIRLRLVLEDPKIDWPPIDPESWVAQRKYSDKNYSECLTRFLEERNASIHWLQNLTDPRWDNAYHHPKFPPISGSMLLANWLAHDYLHIRQITQLKFFYLSEHSQPDALRYAGNW